MAIEIGSARAQELQDSIQRELAVRGWASATDTVMAEFITIMIINLKSSEQITQELSELIGDDYDPEFTDWLFMEAADGDDLASATIASSTEASEPSQPTTSTPASRPAPSGPRASDSAPVNTSPTATKRSRSPSDNGPATRKAPRTSDLPDRPRAMRNDGSQSAPSGGDQKPGFGPRDARNNRQMPARSLLDRVGPPRNNNNGMQNGPPGMNQNGFRGGPQQQPMMFDPVQAQIEAVTQMGMQGFPMGMPMMSMDHMQMQEMMQTQAMMMNQMNQMMQQISQSVGGQQQNNAGPNGAFGGRGRGRGGPPGRGGFVGRGGTPAGAGTHGAKNETSSLSPDAPVFTPSASTSVPIIAPKPIAATSATSTPAASANVPERPGTPTLCKFSVNCMNPACRFSHPSPAATAESALVLNTEACEKGNKCEDKDCTKSHVSPAVNKPGAAIPSAVTRPAPQHTKPAAYHPYAKPSPAAGSSSIPCKFGTNCTRANCAFQHPAGRTTLPGDFHRGITTTAPTVHVDPSKDKARMAAGVFANRYNKTAVFNKPGAAKTSPPSSQGEAVAAADAVKKEASSPAPAPTPTPA